MIDGVKDSWGILIITNKGKEGQKYPFAERRVILRPQILIIALNN